MWLVFCLFTLLLCISLQSTVNAFALYFIRSLIALSLWYSFRKRFTGCYLISVRFSSPALLAMFPFVFVSITHSSHTHTHAHSPPALVSLFSITFPASLPYLLPTGKRKWPQATTFSAIFMLFFRCFCSCPCECPVSPSLFLSRSLTSSCCY